LKRRGRAILLGVVLIIDTVDLAQDPLRLVLVAGEEHDVVTAGAQPGRYVAVHPDRWRRHVLRRDRAQHRGMT